MNKILGHSKEANEEAEEEKRKDSKRKTGRGGERHEEQKRGK